MKSQTLAKLTKYYQYLKKVSPRGKKISFEFEGVSYEEDETGALKIKR